MKNLLYKIRFKEILRKIARPFFCFFICSFLVFSLLSLELDSCSSQLSQQTSNQATDADSLPMEKDVLICHFAHICRSQVAALFHFDILEIKKNLMKADYNKPKDPYIEKPFKPPIEKI